MAIKKILFIVEDLDIGGTELSLLKWIKNCDRGNFEPIIITFRNGELKKELDNLNIKIYLIEKKWAFDTCFLRKLAKKIKELKPDLVHCRNGIPAISYGVLAARFYRIPVVSSIHGRTHYLKSSFRVKIWFWIMKMSSSIIVVTNSIK